MMSENEKKMPKRRFKEFENDDAWEQCKLGDEVEFYSGLTYSPNNVINNSGTLVLRSSNVKNGEIVDTDNVYVSSEVVNSDNVQVGDVIVVVRNGSRSLIGKHAQIKEKMDNTVIGAFMTGVRYQRPEFLNALLGTSQFDKEIEKNMGATINQITTGSFKEMQFFFPLEDEQKCIGDFFNNLDNLITLHQRKLEKMKALRKAYLTEMVPSEGERKPKLRFAGFTDDWEQCKLESVAKYRNGKAHENSISASGKYIVVNSKFVSTDGEVRKFSDEQIEPLYKNEIAFVLSDVPNGRAIARTFLIEEDNKYTLNQRIAGITPLENTYPYFIHLLMNRNRYFLRFDDGAKQTNLSMNDVNGFSEYYPSLQEQTQIGIHFQQLDNLITLHQRKLEKLQNIKNAYLNEMFI